MVLDLLLRSLWLALPAYLPNSAAVLVGGGTPIDFGRKWRDGKRITGDGKTFRGFFGGAACGGALGLLLNLLAPRWGFPVFPWEALVALPLGAMAGDLVKSFFKRRVGVDRGGPLPLADQLDFLLGSWLFGALLVPGWFWASFTPPVMAVLLVVTPGVHLGVNIIGYKMGKKDVWW
ncbi:MAG: CDP-2,3-bis-(O-geranylgeranyl)-sn-glycerol synthase [Euryarchaeota archaeon]|nr:CDP-2,3-bis-(O-geranylgeranyl)-sn-glycerol synthase [Euryarchaeota archaeon]